METGIKSPHKNHNANYPEKFTLDLRVEPTTSTIPTAPQKQHTPRIIIPEPVYPQNIIHRTLTYKVR